jgi:tRNA/rRNA methyltransferase
MKAKLDKIAIVLNEPHFPENIGAAARALKNMGIFQLLLVNPIDCDLTRVLKTATHNAEDIVAGMEVFDSLEDALAPFQYVVGTTARMGSHRQSIKNPRQLALELVDITRKNNVAILFGTESRGLANEHIKHCDCLVTIPTADFSSINLAHSVMIIAYEILQASSEKRELFVPRLATHRELEGMYDHLKETLTKINFINPENPDYWMMNLRRFFGRLHLRARDIQVIRGICRQIDWYCFRRNTGKESQ